MTFINGVNITITIILLLLFIIITIYYRKKIKDLDGFMGIVKEEKRNTTFHDEI